MGGWQLPRPKGSRGEVSGSWGDHSSPGVRVVREEADVEAVQVERDRLSLQAWALEGVEMGTLGLLCCLVGLEGDARTSEAASPRVFTQTSSTDSLASSIALNPDSYSRQMQHHAPIHYLHTFSNSHYAVGEWLVIRLKSTVVSAYKTSPPTVESTHKFPVKQRIPQQHTPSGSISLDARGFQAPRATRS